jgi:protein involved in polysaccharide export with SLBB domain
MEREADGRAEAKAIEQAPDGFGERRPDGPVERNPEDSPWLDVGHSPVRPAPAEVSKGVAEEENQDDPPNYATGGKGLSEDRPHGRSPRQQADHATDMPAECHPANRPRDRVGHETSGEHRIEPEQRSRPEDEPVEQEAAQNHKHKRADGIKADFAQRLVKAAPREHPRRKTAQAHERESDGTVQHGLTKRRHAKGLTARFHAVNGALWIETEHKIAASVDDSSTPGKALKGISERNPKLEIQNPKSEGNFPPWVVAEVFGFRISFTISSFHFDRTGGGCFSSRVARLMSYRTAKRIDPQAPFKIRLRATFLFHGCFGAYAGLLFASGVARAADTNAAVAASAPAADTAGGSLSVTSPAQRAEWQKRLTLGPGDVLSFSLYGYPDLSKSDVVVGPDGRISFLQAQDVLATGLTVDELRAKLDEELAKYYRNPRTVIIPTAFRSKRFYMLGKVATKGVFILDRPMTIIEAVAQARGLETGFFQGNIVELADLPRSFLVRGGKKMPVDFELLFQQGDLSQNIPLEPDDYVFFASANANEIYVFGEVGGPGIQAFWPKASAVSAVAVRGGFTPRAYRQRILVVRGSLNHPETFIVNAAAILAGKAPDFRLQPKDIVYVSERPWVQVEELLDQAIRSFINGAVVTGTGVYLYDRGTR